MAAEGSVLNLCGVVILLGVDIVFRAKVIRRNFAPKAVFGLALGLLPLWAAVASAWVGGPLFHKGERGNIAIQFSPFFLVLIFPAYEMLLGELPRLALFLRPLSTLNAGVFFACQ